MSSFRKYLAGIGRRGGGNPASRLGGTPADATAAAQAIRDTLLWRHPWP